MVEASEVVYAVVVRQGVAKPLGEELPVRIAYAEHVDAAGMETGGEEGEVGGEVRGNHDNVHSVFHSFRSVSGQNPSLSRK